MITYYKYRICATRKNIRRTFICLFLVMLKSILEKQIKHDGSFDPELSRRIDAVTYLIEVEAWE